MGQVKMEQIDTPLAVPAGFVYLLAILMLRSRRTHQKLGEGGVSPKGDTGVGVFNCHL